MSNDATEPQPISVGNQEPAWINQEPAWKRNWFLFQLDILKKVADSLGIPIEQIKINQPRANVGVDPVKDDLL